MNIRQVYRIFLFNNVKKAIESLSLYFFKLLFVNLDTDAIISPVSKYVI